MDYVITIISSILGGLSGGIFTFLGVWLTIKHENKKQKIEELQKINAYKPRFTIIGYHEPRKYDPTIIADLCVLSVRPKTFDEKSFYATYDEETMDEKKWICVDYFLRNDGLTEIEDIYLANDGRDLSSLFDINRNEHKVLGLDGKQMQFATRLKKVIKPQDKFSLRICYPIKMWDELTTKNQYLSIWVQDFNCFYWKMALYSPKQELSDSFMVDAKKLAELNRIPSFLELLQDKKL